MNFGGLGDLGNIFQEAMKMRKEMEKIQESLSQKTVEASSGGGMVKVVANGKQEILSVSIDESLLKTPDPEMLQDLIRISVNQALKNAQELAATEMKKITAGLGPLASLFGNK